MKLTGGFHLNEISKMAHNPKNDRKGENMHKLLLTEIVKTCEQRYTEGDCSTVPRPSGETMEDAILDLAAEVRRLQQENEQLKHAEQAERKERVLDAYDAGLLNDFGGGNVEWWQDYIRAELNRAHDFYSDQLNQEVAAERKRCAEIMKMSNADVLAKIPMEGNFSQLEKDAFCGGVRRGAAAIMEGE